MTESRLPSSDVQVDPARLASLKTRFTQVFPQVRDSRSLRLFSAPGRAEIGGNHTDHQQGRVLAAAVDLDMLCLAAPNDLDVIRIDSLGYHEISLDSLQPREQEINTTPALIRGIASRCMEQGYKVSGFDACITSSVLKGSGLSSSAAFEIAVAFMINKLFNLGHIDPVTLAQIAVYAENVYFDKPCGLMDQLTSSVGGFVLIDFADPKNPQIEPLDFDFSHSGHVLCVTGPLGSHEDLTHAYSAITSEMRSVASYFGKAFLREVDPSTFYADQPELRGKLPDRALLRAVHFFAENRRAFHEAEALRSGNFKEFLRLVNESGRSSYQYLQNVYHGDDMTLATALAESERILDGAGAFRVHGGGFSGTILAFVPYEKLDAYTQAMDRMYGAGSCHVLSIRNAGACELEVPL